MSDCPFCLLPLATLEDYDRYAGGEGEHLCWDVSRCESEADVRGLVTELRARVERRDAEVAELRALLERGRDIVAEYAPGHGVWLDAADLALNPPAPETTP